MVLRTCDVLAGSVGEFDTEQRRANNVGVDIGEDNAGNVSLWQYGCAIAPHFCTGLMFLRIEDQAFVVFAGRKFPVMLTFKTAMDPLRELHVVKKT